MPPLKRWQEFFQFFIDRRVPLLACPAVRTMRWVSISREMIVTEFADKVGITMTNIYILKNSKAKAIRLPTLEAICEALECRHGVYLEYR